MKKVKLVAFWIVWLLALAGVFSNIDIVRADKQIETKSASSDGLIPHAPIHISSNAEFTLENGVVAGSGTESDPYIIENWDIDTSTTRAHGIHIKNTDKYFVIRNCSLHGGGPNYCHGICFERVQHGTITNVTSYNNYNGIDLWYSSGNSVTNSTIYNNSIDPVWSSGVRLYESPNNRLSGNTFINNGIRITSGHPMGYTEDIDTTNIVNGRPVYYFWEKDNIVIDHWEVGQLILGVCRNFIIRNVNISYTDHGITLAFSSNIKITDSVFYNNRMGIFLDARSRYAKVINSTFHENRLGLYLRYSENDQIANCTFNNNYRGIELDYSSHNEIINCTISSNRNVGIYLFRSNYNIIYGNTLVSNRESAWDFYGTNFWDGGYPVGGNYWSDYKGIDFYSGPNQDQPGSDGFGDAPYVICGGGMDHYPLMNLPGESIVNLISPYWQNAAPLTVTASATPRVSGLANVELWTRFSVDNFTWESWYLFAIDTEPWNGVSWLFDFPNGSGYYEFYSRARANTTQYEDPPPVADAICGYDCDTPIANAGADQKVPRNTTVQFNGTNSYDPTPGSGIVNYTWKFINVTGEIVTLYGPTPTYPFNYSGNYTVTLNVTDAAGNWNTDTCVVIVGPDLTLSSSDITFSIRTAGLNMFLRVTANISNIGAEDALNVLVQFYNGSISPENQIGGDKIIDVFAGQVSTTFVEWKNPPSDTSLQIYVIIDQNNDIPEANETNNQANRTVTISSNGVIVSVSGKVNDDFSHVYITFSQVKIYSETYGWIIVSTETKTVDILYLCEHNLSEVLGVKGVSIGDYSKIYLFVENVICIKKGMTEGIIVDILTGDVEINYTFEVVSGGYTMITVHIDLERSIVATQVGYEFIPVIEKIVFERHSFEISISQAFLSILPGESAAYAVTIYNTGTFADTYELALLAQINNAWVDIPISSIFLQPNNSGEVILTFTPPANLSLMENVTYNFTILVMYTYTGNYVVFLTQNITCALTVIATKESKVRYLIDEVSNLIVMLDAMNIQSGIKNSLKAKLNGTLDKLNVALNCVLNGDETAANDMLNCAKNKINAFINEVKAQKGKKISEQDADTLTNSAQSLIGNINDTINTTI